MIDRLEVILNKYNSLCNDLNSEEVYNDFEKVKKLSKEKENIEKIVEVYKKYKQDLLDLEAAKEMLNDDSLADYAKEEIIRLEEETISLEEKLKILLLPKDPNDKKNIIMEIRGAAGGDEANIFAGDLFRMYSKYAERQGWNLEVIHEIVGESGGYTQVELVLKGTNVYSKLKYESGAHRVQRVPETESQGRIHTSTATVLVMPEAEDIDIEINQRDLKIDICRSSGAGGQCVNTTDSAVRVTHIPTGIMVYCQVERSQIRNKERAIQILKTRLYDLKQSEAEAKEGQERRSKIGSGDRSEKVRTYNYPQNRITDHRINFTSMNLDKVMEGHIDEIIEALIIEDEKRKMESENN